jgi:hypothetical protein
MTEPPNRLTRLPIGIWRNIIAQFTPMFGYRDYQSLIRAYPSLQNKLSKVITHLDFFNGRRLVDQTERETKLNYIHCSFSWERLHKTFPKLQEYRYAYGCNLNLHNPAVKGGDFITDPRARYLHVTNLGGENLNQNGINLLKQAIKRRIDRYGSEFTLIVTPSSGFTKRSVFGFSFHNGVLHLEGTYQGYITSEDYNLLPLDIEDTPIQIIKAFAPVIRILGADEVYFLTMFFGIPEYRQIIPHVNVVYLNYPQFKKVRQEFTLINIIEFSSLFEQITEIRFSSHVDGKCFFLNDEIPKLFAMDLRDYQGSWSNVTVMELPIPYEAKEIFQRLFPNVTKFQYHERMKLNYYNEKLRKVQEQITLIDLPEEEH